MYNGGPFVLAPTFFRSDCDRRSMWKSTCGVIKLFAGNFAPDRFKECNGEAVANPPNEALFSLFGTTYGGDRQTTFALPDLTKQAPVQG